MSDPTLPSIGDPGAQTSGDENKILIIGAGCTGLSLAHGLNKASIPHVIYERDTSPTARPRDWNMGLHWALPTLKSLIPPSLFARLQSTQVDPNTPTRLTETLRFLNGKTGETIGEAQIEGFYRLRRSKIRNLLTEGLDVRWGKEIVDTTCSSDGRFVTAYFADGESDTGCMLVGADGPRSAVRKLLKGEEMSKTTNIDYAATMCFSKYTRQQALFLRSERFHSLFQCAPHPEGYFAWFGIHDADDLGRPENWTFFTYVSYPEDRGVVSERKTKAEHLAWQKQLARGFEEPWRSAYEWMGDAEDEVGGKVDEAAEKKIGGEVGAGEKEGNKVGVWYGKMNHWDPQEEGHRWDSHLGRITLAGDAAHPMTFQRGQGLNHAVADAGNLVRSIVQCWNTGDTTKTTSGGGGGASDGSGVGVDEEGNDGDGDGDGGGWIEKRKKAIEEYEDEMIKRGGEEVRLGERNTVMLHDWEKVLLSPVMRKGLGRDGGASES